jgi:hypothetical protein
VNVGYGSVVLVRVLPYLSNTGTSVARARPWRCVGGRNGTLSIVLVSRKGLRSAATVVAVGAALSVSACSEDKICKTRTEGTRTGVLSHEVEPNVIEECTSPSGGGPDIKPIDKP